VYIASAAAEIDKSLFMVRAVLWAMCECVGEGVSQYMCVAMKCACVDNYKNSNNSLGACSSACIMNAQGQG